MSCLKDEGADWGVLEGGSISSDSTQLWTEWYKSVQTITMIMQAVDVERMGEKGGGEGEGKRKILCNLAFPLPLNRIGEGLCN